MRHMVGYSFYKLAGIAGFFAVLLSCISVQSAAAVASNAKMFISADNTFYAYARGGETISASFIKSAQAEPGGLMKHDIVATLEGPGLPIQSCTIPGGVATGSGCDFTNVEAPETGIYRISFALPNGARPYPEVSPLVKWGGNLFTWSILVKDGAVEKTGRIWSELYAARQPVAESFLTDMTYHYVSESGYVYRATYRGYNGQISTFSADAVGIRKDDSCESSYRSVSVTDNQYSPAAGSCGGGYKLFFEQPAGDLPQRTKKWDGKETDWVMPATAAPKVTALKFESSKTGDLQSGKISFSLANFVGQYSVDIDTTGDGSFNSKEDVKIKRYHKKLDDSTQVVAFDGVDARGQIVPISQPIAIRINVEKVAEIHLVNADVEGRTGGLEIVRTNGTNAPSTRMCWNDTELSSLAEAGLQTPKLDGRSCPDSGVGRHHGWAYATGSWGDGRYIDDWAYASISTEGISTIQYPESTTPLVNVTQKNNQSLVIIVGAVLASVFVVLVALIAVRRRRHARHQQQTKQYHHPIDFPGPGDPRQSGL